MEATEHTVREHALALMTALAELRAQFEPADCESIDAMLKAAPKVNLSPDLYRKLWTLRQWCNEHGTD